MNLEQSLKIATANTFAFYLKAHFFHFNVEGPNFHQYHEFFGDLYQEAWTAFDALSEKIRTLEAYAPASFTRLSELSEIQDQTMVPRAELMFQELLNDNDIVIKSLLTAYELSGGKLGLQNFLQDRIDQHEKHCWMLRSHLKASRQ